MEEFYEQVKDKKINVCKKSEIKNGKALSTLDQFTHAKDNLWLAVDENNHIVVAHKPKTKPGEKEVLHEVEIITPPMNAMYNSLDGLGGRYILEDGNESEKRTFSVTLVDGPLEHPKIETDNPEERRPETVKAMLELLEEIRTQCILFKLDNPDVHATYRREQMSLLKKHYGVAFDTDKEFARKKAFCDFALRLKYPIKTGSENVQTEYPETPNRTEMRLNRVDLYEPKEKTKSKGIEIDPRVMAIYNAGESDSNPNYVFAKEVVDSKSLNKQFNPVVITHNDKSQPKFGVFGPFFGRKSTVSFQFKLVSYAQKGLDGIGFYFSAGLVLMAENDNRGKREVRTTYQVDYHKADDSHEQAHAHAHAEPAREDEKKDETDHVDKKQKVDTDE